MNFDKLKNGAKKHRKLYAFLWGLPLYRKAASGGILCALSEDGTIQKSMDKKNNCFYKQHPNTGHPLVGFTIPRWSEAKALALELALEKPGIRYCGWDLALTDDGWIMIEGNEGAELAGIQIFGGGCKPSIERYL